MHPYRGLVTQKRAVVLLSGGLDSCTAATMAKTEGYALYALSFDYGQRHDKELQCAREIAAALDVAEHKVLRLPIGELGGSALTDPDQEVPDAPDDTRVIGEHIPSTYVPARNTIFLAYALGYAEVTEAERIVIGANALDYSGYPDCRPEFLKAFQEMAARATKRGVAGDPVQIHAPLVELTKQEIIREASRLGAPLHLTWSCYRGGGAACGTCESCVLRLKGFQQAGQEDPIPYLQAEA